MSSIYYDIAIFSTYRLVIDILLSQRVRMKLKLSSNFICRHLKDVMHRFKLYLILHSQNRQNPDSRELSAARFFANSTSTLSLLSSTV